MIAVNSPAIVEADVRSSLEGLPACLDPERKEELRQLIGGHLELGTAWVAVSGGVDSVFLLCLIRALFPDASVQVLHFDHCTRNGDSHRDAEWVAVFCEAVGVECRVGSRDSGDCLAESELRRQRYAFFTKEVAARGAPVLFMGHHLDDGLENFLIRTARGAGVTGLVAPRELRPWQQGWISRPLMRVSSAWIRRMMAAAKLPWREDASNASPEYLRNRLRADVVPSWKSIAGRNLLAGFERTRKLLREDADALDAWVETFCAERNNWADRITALPGMPSGFVRRIFQRWANEHCGSSGIPTTIADALVASLAKGGVRKRFVFGGGTIAVDGVNGLFFEPESIACDEPADSSFEFLLVPSGTVFFADGRLLECREEIVSGEFVAAELLRTNVQCEVWIAWQDALKVRNWRRGDRYQPFGLTGSRKLQDCFVDRKIPLRERNRRPVVCSTEGSPLWTPGLLPAEKCRIGNSGGKVLRLTYRKLC